MTKKQKKMLYRIIAALALVLVLKLLPPLPVSVELLLYCIPYLVVGWDVLRKALLGIKNRQPFDECFLMAVATVCSEKGAMSYINLATEFSLNLKRQTSWQSGLFFLCRK